MRHHKRKRSIIDRLDNKPSKFFKANKIGEGCFGSVYFNNSKTNAIKICNAKEDFRREIYFLKKLQDCENVVKMIKYYEDINCIVLEYIETDLYNWLHNSKFTHLKNDYNKLIISKCIINGIDFCHRNQIIHTDIKSMNVLIEMNNGECNAKLCDFGLTIFNENFEDKVYQTIYYRSPDVLFRKHHKLDEKIDIWSYGVLLFEIIFETVFCSEIEPVLLKNFREEDRMHCYLLLQQMRYLGLPTKEEMPFMFDEKNLNAKTYSEKFRYNYFFERSRNFFVLKKNGIMIYLLILCLKCLKYSAKNRPTSDLLKTSIECSYKRFPK